MKQIINELKEADNYRSVSDIELKGCYITVSGVKYLNLSSNDYLSIGASNFQEEFFSELCRGEYLMSNPSSRLMTGNSHHYAALESKIAALYSRESATLFNCGYSLNSGVIPAITSKKGYIIADKLVHASIIDGIRLSEAKHSRFKHNDISHLRTLLQRADGEETLVVLESIYSMDGDLAPLKDIIELKKEYNFKIYLDEAHAFGVRGERGLGLAEELGVMGDIDYIVATLGKAASSCGAFIVGDSLTRELIINRSRTIIYSTALPPINLLWSSFILDKIVNMRGEREHLKKLSEYLSKALNISYQSHIIPIVVGENSAALSVANRLKESGFWSSAIRYPTVAKGAARIRLSLNSSMSFESIDAFLANI